MVELPTSRKPTHPGAFFKHEILDARGISITDAAKKMSISRKALSEFVNEESRLSIEMAKRLSLVTDTSVSLWINFQTRLDIYIAERINLKVGEVTSLPAEIK
jgi:addiction module HigA family antidote